MFEKPDILRFVCVECRTFRVFKAFFSEKGLTKGIR